jgi:hypothetical protein
MEAVRRNQSDTERRFDSRYAASVFNGCVQSTAERFIELQPLSSNSNLPSELLPPTTKPLYGKEASDVDFVLNIP